MRAASRICAAVFGIAMATAFTSLGDVTEAARPDIPAASGLYSQPEPMACCKVCSKGKACGNSCIARDKSCHQPPGCACDG